MTKVFISYSRKDKAFAEKLDAALREIGLNSWIDWIDIPPTADWWDQIQKGIESADAFLFLLSPDSITSKVCGQEVDHAVRNSKRMIPLVVRDVNPQDVNSALTKLNWIFFREQDNFEASLKKLEAGIKTDLSWVELHRRLQVRAIEWERRKDNSLLLRGKDLREAEEQFANAGQKDPQPTDLQRQYVLESRRRESQTRNTALTVGGVVLVMLAFLSVFAFNQRTLANENAFTAVANQHLAQTAQLDAVHQKETAVANEEEAKRQLQISRAGELAAQSVALRDKNFAVSLLLGVEAFNTLDNVQTRGTLLDTAQANPQLQAYLTGHTDIVWSVAFSPDGKTLASGSCGNLDASADCHQGEIILWDVATRGPIGQPLNGHSEIVTVVAFSPDGNILASGGGDNTIILWDLETRQPIGQPLNGHSEAVTVVAFSPDGNILASGSYDTAIILWDVKTGHQLGQPLTVGDGGVETLAFSPDGKVLATADDVDNAILLWDVETGQPIGQPLTEHIDFIKTLAFSPDGKTLAWATCGELNPNGVCRGNIILWDLEAGQLMDQPLMGHASIVWNIAFSPDGKVLASASEDSTVILWDTEKGQPIGQPLIGHTRSVRTVAFSPDGKTLASGSEDGNVILWNIETRLLIGQPLIVRFEYAAPIIDVAFRPDGKTLASVGSDPPITWWDIETRQYINQPWDNLISLVLCIAFSPEGKMLALGDFDGNVILLDVETRQPIGQPLTGHIAGVYDIAFRLDGKVLASGGQDGTIILWDVETRQPIGQPLTGHIDSVGSVAFRPDGKVLASSGQDGTIILWDIETRQPIGQPLIGHTGGVNNVVFSPDGNVLASGGDDDILLWSVETGQPIGQLRSGRASIVWSLAFSSDGRTLASGNYENTIILWDVETRQPIGQPLIGHTGGINNVVFSPDGKTLASGSADTRIILWDLDSHSWIQKTCQRAGRNFTRAEWAQYFPNEEYRKTCEQWSLEPEVVSTPSPTP